MSSILNIREQKARRNTLNHENIMMAMHVKILSEPRDQRLLSIDDSELESAPWLKFLKTGSTSSFEIPRSIKPNSAKLTNLKCEEDFDSIEKEDKSAKSIQNFIDFINDPKSGGDYVSIPIINNRSKDNIARLAYKFNEKPTPLNFLHIQSVKFDLTGVGSSVFMQFFVYCGQPFTEPVQMQCNTQRAEFSRFNHKSQEIILPFPRDQEKSFLVCILYMPLPEADSDGNLIAIPIGVGNELIMNCVNTGFVTPSFCYFDPTIPLSEHFTREPNMKLKIEFTANVFERLQNESRPLTTRIMSFSNMYPTPLLTFYDIGVTLKHKFSSKKTMQCHIFVKITLKAPGENGKLTEVKLFTSPAAEQLGDFGSTTRVAPKSDHLFFPDHINFQMAPDVEDPLTATVEIILARPGKLKALASTTFAISHPFHSYSNLKMDSKGNMLSLKYSFPTVFAPPKNLRPALMKPFEIVSTKDSMYNEVAPYILNKNLSMDSFPNLSFKQLFEMIPLNKMKDIQLWVEHYFTCTPGFTEAYTKKFTDSLQVAASFPMPFFLILFKSMCIEKKLNEEALNELLAKCASFSKNPDNEGGAFKASVADFILQLRMAFRPDMVFKIAYKYLAQLSISDRLDVYTYLFYDIAFVQSLTFNYNINLRATISPHIPLFSLFYKTLNQTFTENKKDAVNAAAAALSLLATTLEQFSNSETSAEIARMIFPLLPMIFTFYDSLITQLGGDHNVVDAEGNIDHHANGAILMPIILFFLKNCDSVQFINYYNILSDDSQLRFLDFLCGLTDEGMVQAVAGNAPNSTKSELAITHEITIRILIFLSFYEKIELAEERTLHNIFNLLLHMLLSTKQASESYALLFKSIAFFISRYPNLIFMEKTTLISQLLNTIVPLTQRKLHNARIGTCAFITWLIDLEVALRDDSSRCDLALQYATCDAFFSNANFIPFFDQLPTGLDHVKKLYTKLNKAVSAEIHEHKIMNLIQIAKNDYKNFPAIRARIYSHIVELNQNSGDIPSAFVVQWRLCGFIAEVFKMKNQIVDGIPAAGISAFPFIFDEPPIDMTAYSEHNSYLVMESEMFNESYISVALKNALMLCQKAGFNWLISQVTEYLFDNLERRREFLLLKNLYESVSQSYTALYESEKPKVEFARIFLAKPLSDKFEFEQAIRVSPIGKMELFAETIGPEGKCSNSDVPLTEGSENEYQITKVHFNIDKLKKLKTQEFTKDIITQNSEIEWDDTYVKRFIFQTVNALPYVMSYSLIKNVEIKTISKHDFYIEKMNRFRDSFQKKLESIVAVLPPKKMISQWGQCVLNITAAPLLHKIGKIVNTSKNDEDTKKPAFYDLILNQHIKNGNVPMGVPQDITVLSDAIWKIMVDSVKLIDKVFALNKPQESEKEMLALFRKTLNVPSANIQINQH